MKLDGMSETELQDLEAKLLALVAPDGSGTGNSSLIGQLAWDDELYWNIRNRLVDRGVLVLGRGRGGSVKLAQPRVTFGDTPTTPLSAPAAPREPIVAGVALQAPASLPAEEVASAVRVTEDALYEPIAGVLRDQWLRNKRYDQAVVEITARQGARLTGGRWSRPDLVLASLTTYPYVPGKHFDITTFEVKSYDAMDVTAVYEALAHLRTATRAYVVLWVPDEYSASLQQSLEVITEEADRHGVGLLVVGDPGAYDTWDERVQARRREPDPEKLNDFLSKQVSAWFKEQIIKWYR